MIERTEADIMKNWKGDTSSPFASICTRTYNLENYVAEALDSFLMQETDFSFEIVVDDDCSTDNTVKVIERYLEKFPNIIRASFLKKNVGLRTNFIKNMQRAEGKYIALCDGDDYWTDPMKLQKQVDFLENNAAYVLTYAPMEPVYENGATRRSFNWSSEDMESLEIQKNFVNSGICTICFRNVDVIRNYPCEHRCAPLDDNFLESMLGAYGKGKFLKEIAPSKYRQHSEGDYTNITKYEKNMKHYQTHLALYMYYLRIGNAPLSEHFHKKSLEYSLTLHGRAYYLGMVFNSLIDQGFQYVVAIYKGIKKRCFANKSGSDDA